MICDLRCQDAALPTWQRLGYRSTRCSDSDTMGAVSRGQRTLRLHRPARPMGAGHLYGPRFCSYSKMPDLSQAPKGWPMWFFMVCPKEEKELGHLSPQMPARPEEPQEWVRAQGEGDVRPF